MSKASRKLVALTVAPASLVVVLAPLWHRLPLPDAALGCAVGMMIGLSVLGLLTMAGKAKYCP